MHNSKVLFVGMLLWDTAKIDFFVKCLDNKKLSAEAKNKTLII